MSSHRPSGHDHDHEHSTIPDDTALRYLGRFETRLRAGDALHLAIANNHRAAVIYSLDRTLVDAGKILNLPVSMGIRAK